MSHQFTIVNEDPVGNGKEDNFSSQFLPMDSVSESALSPSQRAFKMIFMNSTYSNRNLSNEFQIQNPTLASCQLSCRTMMTARLTASLRKAVSSMKIHSWKTEYTVKEMSSIEINDANNMLEKVGSKQVEWHQEFSCAGPIVDSKDVFMYNKLFARLRTDDDMIDILSLMLHGVSLFCYNLQYGTIDDHSSVWNRVAQARKFASHVKDIPFVFSIIPELSYRLPMTGKLKKGLKRIKLVTGSKIIVTADRSYSRRCSKKVIYVNFRHYIFQLRPPDTIQIDEVTLRVRRVVKISLECDVLMGGHIAPKMEVHLPAHCRPDVNRLSSEELEDLTFLIANGINCILLPLAGNDDYLDSIKTALQLLKFNEMRILARVREIELLEETHAQWIAKNYEGVILMCESCPCSQNVLLESTKKFMKLCYDTQRPIILQCTHSIGCLKGVTAEYRKDSFEYFFFYPDGYYLTGTESAANFQLIHRSTQPENVAEVDRLALEKLNEPFVDKSLTGSDTMARVICKMTYDFNAKAIMICSASGRMAMKISHFRPKCPIIVLMKNQKATRFLKIFYNVRIAFYQEMPEAKKLSRKDMLTARLLHGLVHGLTLQMLEDGDVIVFCYKDPADVAYTNVAIPFVLDANTVRKQFDSLTEQTKQD